MNEDDLRRAVDALVDGGEVTRLQALFFNVEVFEVSRQLLRMLDHMEGALKRPTKDQLIEAIEAATKGEYT